MSVYLDTSAVVALCLDVPARDVALGAFGADDDRCSSAVTLAEALALVPRLGDDPQAHRELEDAVRLVWDRLAIVPVDQRCLDRASTLLREHGLRLADALHLAAADRLPRPIRFVTFDAPQIPIALSLGFDVVSL
jgi:predicted nucleic acid-binding protein